MRHIDRHAPAGEGGRPDSRTSLYDEVTQRVIAQMEAGHVPWVQPWGVPDGGGAATGLPFNASTGRPYSGINILILWGALFEGQYPSQGWLTFRQALNAGGHVRKGERGVTVVYADRFVPEAEKSRAWDDGGEARSIPFLKRFTVFNLAQCDGLAPGTDDDTHVMPERAIAPLGEAMIAASGVEFASVETGPFMHRMATSCRYRRRPPSSIRSTIIAPASMS